MWKSARGHGAVKVGERGLRFLCLFPRRIKVRSTDQRTVGLVFSVFCPLQATVWCEPSFTVRSAALWGRFHEREAGSPLFYFPTALRSVPQTSVLSAVSV